MKYINVELGKYNFKVKGWSYTLKVITEDDPLTDEFGYVTAFGCQYHTEKDTMNTNPSLVHNVQRCHHSTETSLHHSKRKKSQAPASSPQSKGLQKREGANKRSTGRNP